jgi:hypothetical protein
MTMPAGEVNVGNFREGSDGPYAAALERTGVLDGQPADATTPIQQALATPQPEGPYTVPAAQAPAATEQATPPATLASPYETAAPAEPEGEQAPSWVQDLRAEQAQTRQFLEQVAQQVQGLPGQLAPPAAEEPPNLDLMSTDELRNYISEQSRQQAQELFQQQIAPFTDVLGRAVQRESEEAAKAYFTELEPHVGKFDHDQAHVTALGLTAQGVDPAQAMLIAAQRQHAFEKQMWTQWSQTQQGVINNVVSAPNELPAGPAAGSEIQPTPTGRNAYEQAKDTFLAERRPRPIPTA